MPQPNEREPVIPTPEVLMYFLEVALEINESFFKKQDTAYSPLAFQPANGKVN